MDETGSTNLDFEIDIEKGGMVSEEDLNKTPVLSTKRPAKLFISKLYDGFVDVPAEGEVRIISLCGNDKSFNDFNTEINVNAISEKTPDERGVADEKRKKTSYKKSPKPPKPPRGPSLDAADMKLIKEISELAMIKRARIERVKALKKIRAAKTSSSSSSSSNSNVFALVFTVLFFLVIAFQVHLQ